MFKIQTNNNKKKFPFKENKVYVIYYNPPHAYIDLAHRLVLSAFSNFEDEWTIEYNGIEGKVRAILLYYGLPLMKYKVPNTKEPNLVDLENSSNKQAYYRAKMYWLLSYLENVQFNQIKKILDLIKTTKGKPIKVKELEGKQLTIYPGNIKGRLLDLYTFLQEAKSIDITLAVKKGGLFSALSGFSLGGINKLTILRVILALLIIALAGIIIHSFFQAYNTLVHPTYSPNNNTYIKVGPNGTYYIINPLQ
jgi:hypothetical protein